MKKIRKMKQENKMIKEKFSDILKDRKKLLSTMWIFAVLNYLYCDVMTLMDSHLLRQFLTGTVENIRVTEGFLLGAAVLMEISISMVLLSRILPYRGNRWANIIAGIITTVVQITSVFAGKPTAYYIFFSAFEISATIAVFIIALKWKAPSRQSEIGLA
jgi:hypothetical protein